nr:hypothetical protein CFP56_25274 [Quercus suber]
MMPSSPSVKRFEEKGISVIHEVKCKLCYAKFHVPNFAHYQEKLVGQFGVLQIWLLRSCTKEPKGTWRNFAGWLGGFGIGVVVRDSDSRFIAAMCLPLQGRYSVEETEAAAVEQGCVLAKKLGLERVIIESDSLLTVQAVEANDVRGVVGHFVKGIVQSLCNFQESKIRHINRTSNKIAHELAKHARRIRESAMWRMEIPDFLSELARSEGASLVFICTYF